MPLRIYGSSGYTELQTLSTAVANTLTLPTSGTKLLSDTPTSGTNTLAAIFQNTGETVTVSASAATGALNYDVLTQSVLYYTSNATATFTVNIRGNGSTSLNTVLATGQAVTVVFMVTQGASGASYYQTAMTIDGTSITPKWQGGLAPTAGNASGIDIYTYTIIKTGSAAFTALATQSQFK
jgi:membrane-bound inhibitor of C-type lysozyme